ncbi:MAG: hypothetical protein ABIE92_14930 [bacterium]
MVHLPWLDFWLLKLDSHGQEEWSTNFGGELTEECNWVDQTMDGGYVLAGHTLSYGAGQRDIYVVRTDSEGDIIWDYTNGTEYHDWGTCVEQTDDGGYFITGYGKGISMTGPYDVHLIRLGPVN